MIKYLLLFSLALLLFSCGPTNDNKAQSQTNDSQAQSMASESNSASSAEENGDQSFTIMRMSKEVFIDYKDRWKEKYKEYVMSTDSMTYFEVPFLDQQTYVDSFTSNAFMFLGLEELKGIDPEATAAEKYTPHLMIIGKKNGALDYDLILDYSHFCPPHCKE